MSYLALTVLGAASCAGSVPAAGEAAPRGGATAAPVASVPTVAEAPVADAGEPAAPPAPGATVEPAPPSASCERAERVDVPELLRPLFEKGRRSRFLVKDDVDPHAPDGGRAVTKAKVECVVSSLCRFEEGAVSSELTCKSDAGEPDVLPATIGFLSSAGSLWMPAQLPTDEAGARKALLEAPLLPPNPVKGRRAYEKPGMFEGITDSCTEVLEVTSALVCRDVRCAVKRGYGDTQDRTCVSPSRGLASWRRVNLEGPRTTTWELLDSKPPAPGK